MDFTPPSEREVQEQIAALNQLDLRSSSCDIDFLKDQLTPLMRGFRIKSPTLDRGLEIYRGVPWDAAPCKVGQLGCPPRTKIKDYQRANRPREPRFYCSFDRRAPFFELRLLPGQHVAISKWRLRDTLWVSNVGYTARVFGRLNSVRKEMPSWKTSAPFREDAVNTAIDEFLSDQFARDVPRGSEHLYKVSVAIAEKFTTAIKGNV